MAVANKLASFRDRFLGGKKNPLSTLRNAASQQPRQAAGSTPPPGVNSFDATRRRQTDLTKRQFAESRRGLGAQKDALGRQFAENVGRQAAISGGPSGATIKATQKGTEDLARQFAGAEAQLGAAEAGQLAAIEQGISAQEFAQAERLGAQQFAAQQAGLDREQQTNLFDKQLDFAKDSFFAEMELNKLVTKFNVLDLLKGGGFLDGTMDEINNLWSAGLGDMFGPLGGVPQQDPDRENVLKQTGHL